jgi:hypothetical protein
MASDVFDDDDDRVKVKVTVVVADDVHCVVHLDPVLLNEYCFVI